MHLQVLRVSTGKSHTKTQWEKVIKKIKKRFKCGFGFRFRLEIEATWQTQWANFDALDNVNVSKQQQSNNTQCAAMHSRLLRDTLKTRDPYNHYNVYI